MRDEGHLLHLADGAEPDHVLVAERHGERCDVRAYEVAEVVHAEARLLIGGTSLRWVGPPRLFFHGRGEQLVVDLAGARSMAFGTFGADGTGDIDLAEPVELDTEADAVALGRLFAAMHSLAMDTLSSSARGPVPLSYCAPKWAEDAIPLQTIGGFLETGMLTALHTLDALYMLGMLGAVGTRKG